ncbi:hypothetical protein [Aquimarina sp. 2201CG5-10]|uniref:hypothetical protein n=1 Tax=Aquimarina callyspongiae TaxID=3098150 RepID=UPI002AB46250|nr:hypothetical protein [Aquimarina sp. 2201CG5-10]MDY8138779.1 hypothetical protein [Aquimarina sp. 2201CG5-10]
MKRILIGIVSLIISFSGYSQIDANSLMGLPTAADLTEINAIVSPNIGSVVFNLNDNEIYRFTSTGWQLSTDNQTLSLSGSTLSISGGNSVVLPNVTTFYTADGTLTGTRTVNGGGNSLTFNNLNALQLNATNIQAFSNQAFQLGSIGNVTQISGASGIQLQDDTAVQGNISVTGSFTDSSGDAGSLNQVLSSTVTGTNWVDGSSFDTDDQTASEVNSDTPIDVDGDGATEATVEDVIQDIAPITSKAARIFYPPSIAIDASTIGNNRTVDLYQEYITQFGTPTAASNGAPAAIPTYSRSELYYYVTFADPVVFGPPANISIGGTGDGANEGVMTYDIIATPPDFNTLINVVFVVK